MQIHELIQGSPEWHAYRANHYNASDAPAMMGVSPYKTRSELIHERATGIAKEIDAGTQARFDDGHRFEALARPVAESIIGEDLYPVTGSLGKLSASFDGLTMGEDIAFEHKTLNDSLRASIRQQGGNANDFLAPMYQIQMEQQLMVSGAGRALFMATKWDGETLVEERHCWYKADHALRAQIVAGWEQFEKDLETYEPRELAEKPVAEAILALPALVANIRGEVVATNLPQFKAAAEQFIANIKTDLKTDEDFSNAEATVKFCKSAEERIEHAKSAAIAQTASIDDLMRTVDHIQDQLRTKRLALEKLVKTQKEQIKESILVGAKKAYAVHVSTLEAEITPIRLALPQPDFAGAMKNKRTLAGLHDAVDTLLASVKIAANEAATGVRAKLAWHKEGAKGYETLFPDLQAIIGKAMDDFQLTVNSRIDAHKKAEEERAARTAAIAIEVAPKAATAIAAQSGGIVTADEPRRAHLQSCTDQFLADNRLPLPESITARDALIDAGITPEVSDKEIVEAAIEAIVGLGLTSDEAAKRLEKIYGAAARERYEVAA